MQNKDTSYPRNKIKILLLENISDAAVEQFKESGYAEVEKVSGALSEKELIEKIKGVHIVGIRSKSKITASVIENADKLLAIGAFCIGTNQIDLDAATTKGIAVFNAPYSNTRSVAELIVGLCVMLIRKISDKNIAAHNGIWLKEAKGSFELRGKTLGIIGYGNIGSQVSVLAESLGLKVIYYDVVTKLPLGNAKQVKSLKEILKKIRHRNSARSVGCFDQKYDKFRNAQGLKKRRDFLKLQPRRCRGLGRARKSYQKRQNFRCGG